MLDELGELCGRLRADPAARVLVLSGSDSAFSAGFDLAEMPRLASLPRADLEARLARGSSVVANLHTLPQAVVAAIDGAAVGAGLAIAMAADLRLATEGSRFAAPFVRIGLSAADMGTSWLLPRLVGLGVASDLVLTGRTIDAAEALRVGLVNRVVEQRALESTADELARSLAGHSPAGVALSKELLHSSAGEPQLSAALDAECGAQAKVAGGPDLVEGLAARREGRPPRFSDRRP